MTLDDLLAEYDLGSGYDTGASQDWGYDPTLAFPELENITPPPSWEELPAQNRWDLDTLERLPQVPSVLEGGFGGRTNPRFVPSPGTVEPAFDPFASGDAELLSGGEYDPFSDPNTEIVDPIRRGQKYWLDTEGTYHSIADEPPPPVQSKAQKALLSRRARIRQDILNEDAKRAQPRFQPEEVGPVTQTLADIAGAGEAFGRGVGQGAGRVEIGLGGVLEGAGRIARNPFFGGVGALASDALENQGETISSFGEDVTRRFQSPEDQAHPLAVAAGSFVPQLVPIAVAAAIGGVPAASVTMGLLSGGETFRDARNRFVSDGDSVSDAELKALPVGALSGIISGFIASKFGPTGAMALSRGLSTATAREAIVRVMKDAGFGALQSGADTLARDLVRFAGFEPEKTIHEIVTDTAGATLAGGAFGGATGALHEIGSAMVRNYQTKLPPTFSQQSVYQATMNPRSPISPISGATANPQAGRPFAASQQALFPPGTAGPFGNATIPPTGAGMRPPMRSMPQTKLNRYGKIATATLKGLGASDKTAKDFADVYIATQPEPESLSQFRDDLINAFHGSGLVPENSLPKVAVTGREQAAVSNAEKIARINQAWAQNEALPITRQTEKPEDTENVPRGTIVSQPEPDFTGQPGEAENAPAVAEQPKGVETYAPIQRTVEEGRQQEYPRTTEQVQIDRINRDIAPAVDEGSAGPGGSDSLRQGRVEQAEEKAPKVGVGVNDWFRRLLQREHKRVVSEAEADDLIASAENEGKSVDDIRKDFVSAWPHIPPDVKQRLKDQVMVNLGFWDGSAVDPEVVQRIIPNFNPATNRATVQDIAKTFGNESAKSVKSAMFQEMRRRFTDAEMFQWIEDGLQANDLADLSGFDRGTAGIMIAAHRSVPQKSAQPQAKRLEVPKEIGERVEPTAPTPVKALPPESAKPAPVASRRARTSKPPKAEKPPKAATQVAPAAKVTGTEQKKYLLHELDKALAVAPDEITQQERDSSEASKDLSAFFGLISPDNVPLATSELKWAAVAPLAEKYRVKLNTQKEERMYELGVMDLEAAIKYAIQRQLPHIRIEVPNDGEFAVVNTKHAIKTFREEARKHFPTTVAKASTPSLPSAEAKAIPKVNPSPTSEDIQKVANEFISPDESRFVLHYTVSNGTEMVATDGRRMIRIAAKGLPGTPSEFQWYKNGKPVEHPATEVKDANNKPTGELAPFHYPDYTQVTPKRDRRALIFSGVETEPLIKALRQARLTLGGKDAKVTSVTIWKNADSSIAVSAKAAPEQLPGDEYEHNLKPDAAPFSTFNVNYLIDGLNAVRSLGSSKVDIYAGDENDMELAPMVMVGKDFEYVLMPMRGTGSANELVGKSEDEQTAIVERWNRILKQDTKPFHRELSAPIEPVEEKKVEPTKAKKGKKKPQATFTLESTPPSPTETPALKGTGLESLKANIENSSLSPVAKQIARAFLNLPFAHEMDWSWLEHELTHYKKGQWPASRLGRLVSFTNASTSEAIPHEFAHFFWDSLPESIKEIFRALREQALEDRFGDNVPPAFASGDMTSADFRQGLASGKYRLDDYALINDAEFFAHFFAKSAVTQLWRDRLGKSLWQRIKDWFRRMMDALLRLFRRVPDKDRVVREVMEGRWKPDPNDFADVEEASFFRTGEEAQNAAAVVQEAAARKREGEDALAQSDKIRELLEKHGAGAAPVDAQIALGLPEFRAIHKTGENLNGARETYAQLKGRSSPERTLHLANVTNTHVNDFDFTLAEAQAEGLRAMKILQSPTHQHWQARVNAAKLAANNADVMNQVANSYFDTAFNLTNQILQQEKLNDVEIARLEGQLAAIQSSAKSLPAMRQIIGEMIAVLASNAQGQALLNNPNPSRQDILRVYKDIKRAAGQPLNNDTLLSFAAYMLAKNNNLRDGLYAAHLSQQSPIRGALGAYQAQFLASYQKDPVGTMIREMRLAQNRQSMADKTRFTWLQMNKALLEHDAPLLSKVEAGVIAKAIASDPEWERFRREVGQDVVTFGPKKPITPLTDKFLTLPNGQTVDIGINRLNGDPIKFAQAYADFQNADHQLEQWLANPANQNHTERLRFLADRETLRNVYLTLAVLHPSDSTGGLFTSMLKQVRETLRYAGGRVAAGAQKPVDDWNKLNLRTATLFQQFGPRFARNRRLAMESHKIKRGPMGGRTVQANRQYYGDLMNYLAWTWAQPETGLRVGDPLPDGSKVTAQDLADLKTQADFITEGMKLIPNQTSEVTLGKHAYYRAAHKTSPYMVIRTYHWDMMRYLAEPFMKARNEYRAAMKAGNAAGAAAAKAAMIEELNNTWNNRNIGLSFVIDRDPYFVKATPYDGPAGPLHIIGNQMRLDKSSVPSFDSLIDQIVALSGQPRDEVENTMLIDFGNSIERWHKEAENDSGMILPKASMDANGNVVLIESKNPTTKARGRPVAPFAFYDYGIADTQALARFAAAVHSSASDRVVAALQAVAADLTRMEDELGQKVKRDVATGMSERQAIRGRLKENRLMLQNEQTYDQFTRLKNRREAVANVIAALTGYDPLQDITEDSWLKGLDPQNSWAAVRRLLSRYVGDAVGLMVSGTRTTLKNPVYGWTLTGQMMNRISNVPLLNNIVAAFWVAFRTIQTYGSAGWGAIKPSTRQVTDFGKAIVELAKGHPRDALDLFFKEFVEEIGEKALMRLGTYRELYTDGLLSNPQFSQKLTEEILGDVFWRGQIMREEMSVLEKTATAPLLPFEFALSTWLSVGNPTFGDTALNIGAFDALRSPGGPIWQHEKAIKRLVRRYQKQPWRQFNFADPKDPVNILGPHEVFPMWDLLGRLTAHTLVDGADVKALNDTRQIFREAGLGSYDELAVKMMADVMAGNKAARLLDPAQLRALGSHLLGSVNQPQRAVESLVLQKKNPLATLLRPFQPYRMRTLVNFMSTMRRPTAGAAHWNPKTRALFLWTMIFFSVILPFLIVNGPNQVAAELLDRWLAFAFHKMRKPQRTPGESESERARYLALARYAVGGIPYIDSAANAMLTDLPQSANMTINIPMVEKAQDIFRWAGGAMQTGDPFYGFTDLAGSFMPDSRVVLARLPSTEGTRLIRNVSNLLRRYGPTEQLRPAGVASGGENMSELTPYGRDMANYAALGDTSTFISLYNEAVAKAYAMGLANPEQRVKQMFTAQNPYNKALRTGLTEDQMAEFKSRLGLMERGEVEMVEKNLSDALLAISDREMHFTKVRDEQRRAAEAGMAASRLAAPRQNRNVVPGFRMPSLPKSPLSRQRR